MSADISRYLALITSEHAGAVNFVATVGIFVQGLADLQDTLAAMPGLFDLDVAVGDQLDKTGQRIGLTRFIAIPDPTDFFSFDITGLGFDQGVWYSPYSILSSILDLDDADYRQLLRAKALANKFDGSIPGAYAVWTLLFAAGTSYSGYTVGILNLGHKRMLMLLVAPSLPVPDLVLALFSGPYLDLRPAGVEVEAYVIPTVAGAPFFGFDIEGSIIAGFDVGAWGALLPERWTLFNPSLGAPP